MVFALCLPSASEQGKKARTTELPFWDASNQPRNHSIKLLDETHLGNHCSPAGAE